MPDLFISYARADSRDFVARLSAALEARGKDTWVDLDDIPAASSWNDELRAGIEASDSFCFVISPASVVSANCRAEVDHAVALGKRILPVLHLKPDDADVPGPIGSRNWIPQLDRFLDDFDVNLTTLVTAAETDLDWVREHTRWGLRAQEWERRAEDRSLLARGTDLDQAEAFLSSAGGREPAPTELQGRYVLASRRAATRRQRQLVAAVSVALVVAIVLGVLALLQRNQAVDQKHEAERQRASATSRALVADAFLELPTDPELSVLLAVQAAKASPSTEVERALRSALLASQVERRTDVGGAAAAATYSPDGAAVVTLSDDGTAALRDGATGRTTAALKGLDFTPLQVRWSADSSRFVVREDGDTALVYDGRTGALVSTLAPQDGATAMTDVAISSDGRYVVTAPFVDGAVHLWDADDGTDLGSLALQPVDGIALSPDDSLLVAAVQQKGVYLIDTDGGSLIGGWPGDAQEFFSSVAFSPDGSAFETAGGDGLVTIRSSDGTLLSTFHAQSQVADAAFSPDGKELALAEQDGSAHVVKVADGSTVSTFLGGVGELTQVAFSPDGAHVATAGNQGTIQVWRASDGLQTSALIGHQGPVEQLSFSPDGQQVLSAGADGTVRTWSANGPQRDFPQQSSIPVADTVGSVLSPGGTYLAVSAIPPDTSTSTQVTVVNVATGKSEGDFGLGDDQLVPGLSPDGRLVVTTTGTGSTVRNTTDGTAVAHLPLTSAYDAAFSADEKRVLVVWEKGQAAVYDVATGQAVAQLTGHALDHEVIGAAFSTDGTRVATASVDGTARIWDARTGKQVAEVTAFGLPHKQYTQLASVAFSPDGSQLLTAAGYEANAQLWDAGTGAHLTTLRGSDVDLAAAGFSPDGRFVLTAPDTGGVRLWDAHSYQPLATMTDPSDFVTGAGFTSGDGVAVVGDHDAKGAAVTLGCLVCAGLGSLVAVAQSRLTRGLTAAERATYLGND